MSDPSLSTSKRERLVRQLMTARRAVGAAKRSGDAEAMRQARVCVDRAKRGLGERGPAWWSDGAKDFGRHMVRNTPYADWFAGLSHKADDDRGRAGPDGPA